MDNEVVASIMVGVVMLIVIIPLALLMREIKKENDQLDKAQAAKEKSKATLGI